VTKQLGRSGRVSFFYRSRGSTIKNIKSILSAFFGFKESGVFIALISIAIFFTFTSKTFLTPTNLMNVLRQTSVLGIMTVAVTLLMISQEFDLSIGSVFAIVPILSVLLIKRNFPIGSAFTVSLLAGGMLGLVNGFIVTKSKIPSFITTLGTMMVYRGLVLIISGGWPQPLPARTAATEMMGGSTPFGFVPVPIFWFILVTTVGSILLHKTTYGYKVFATGGNIQAARLSGINTDRIKIGNFFLTALAAGLAGIVALCYMGTAAPTQGAGYELEAIAATVIGGTALFGGVGSILGAFLGAFILAVIRNGLVLLRVSAYLQQAALGVVIILAVIINVRITGRRR